MFLIITSFWVSADKDTNLRQNGKKSPGGDIHSFKGLVHYVHGWDDMMTLFKATIWFLWSVDIIYYLLVRILVNLYGAFWSQLPLCGVCMLLKSSFSYNLGGCNSGMYHGVFWVQVWTIIRFCSLEKMGRWQSAEVCISGRIQTWVNG